MPKLLPKQSIGKQEFAGCNHGWSRRGYFLTGQAPARVKHTHWSPSPGASGFHSTCLEHYIMLIMGQCPHRFPKYLRMWSLTASCFHCGNSANLDLGPWAILGCDKRHNLRPSYLNWASNSHYGATILQSPGEEIGPNRFQPSAHTDPNHA